MYRGVQESSGTPVAIKMERISNGKASFLFHEARVMQEIQKWPTLDGLPALAALRYFGQEGNYRMLIMDLMGSSLEDLHEKRRRFSLKTTLMIGIQVVSRLEFVHSTGYIHRDLKPDNFVLGHGEHRNRIHLIDFGLSTRYACKDGKHREEQRGKSFIGTARYASARTHEGFSQSRRDDIEQLVYVLIYLYRGRLPWSGLQIADRDEKEREIGRMKRTLALQDVCKGCPHSFVLLLNYARRMEYAEVPNYNMIRALLAKELQDQSLVLDDAYDWDEVVAVEPSTLLSPVRNSGGKGGVLGIQSDAEGQGILSGPQSQDITSLGTAD